MRCATCSTPTSDWPNTARRWPRCSTASGGAVGMTDREAILKAAMEAGCDEAERLGYGSELGYAEAASIGEKAARVVLDAVAGADDGRYVCPNDHAFPRAVVVPCEECGAGVACEPIAAGARLH